MKLWEILLPFFSLLMLVGLIYLPFALIKYWHKIKNKYKDK